MQVQSALRSAGLESSDLVLAIDLTKSNEWSGKQSFQGAQHPSHRTAATIHHERKHAVADRQQARAANRARHLTPAAYAGRCLHSTETDTNPYNSVIRILGRTLSAFDDDQLIPTYGFGDLGSKDHSLVSFDATGAGAPIKTLDSVLTAYNNMISKFQLSGPTSFAPAIFKAIEICRESKGQYHILVIVADGQVRRCTPCSYMPVDADVPADISVPARTLPCSTMLAAWRCRAVRTGRMCAGVRGRVYVAHSESNRRGEQLSDQHSHGGRGRRALRSDGGV